MLLSTLSHKPSRGEISQPLRMGEDEQIGTKSRGLFSVWASSFKHLHSPAIERPIWQKKPHPRCVKQGNESCISPLLQLFLIYDIITHQGHQPAGSLTDSPASVLQGCQRASCATHYTAFFCCSLSKHGEKKLTVSTQAKRAGLQAGLSRALQAGPITPHRTTKKTFPWV